MAERQIVTKLDQVRCDHLARYEWAARRLGGKVVADVACGVGYGSFVLAEAGCTVTALDRDATAIAQAKTYWPHERVEYICDDAAHLVKTVDAIVSFETIEHLYDPEAVLRIFAEKAPRLCVPNEEVIPFSKERFPFHEKHYVFSELEQMLARCGWTVRERLGQRNKSSSVAGTLNGRTIVVDAIRST